ncbi:hypothetical protein H0H87_002174, partial [Tephrocybe sp. NHM501043]
TSLAELINALGLLPKDCANVVRTKKAAYALYDDFADLPLLHEASEKEREFQWCNLQVRFKDFNTKE